MKITDMIITAMVKRGVLYEAKNTDVDVEIPVNIEGLDKVVKVNIKCENMTIRIEKES
ncbi:hypothetical protein [Bacteroides sp.]|uniref:hypothetical protein n=1 Tax=Bacteroides sp. TaxID=29523 RepID=UPI002602DE3F|nr:hypothetical protein [Bacteroides sp.]MDD3040033.1 hypothetical protein [Bacteroides sp.]